MSDESADDEGSDDNEAESPEENEIATTSYSVEYITPDVEVTSVTVDRAPHAEVTVTGMPEGVTMSMCSVSYGMDGENYAADTSWAYEIIDDDTIKIYAGEDSLLGDDYVESIAIYYDENGDGDSSRTEIICSLQFN